MNSRQLTIYRECTPVVDDVYDTRSDRAPVKVIIGAVAEAAGVDPVELPPLYDFVDPEALNRLFARDEGTTDSDTLLSFQIETWNVFVRNDGHVRVCDARQPTEPAPVFDSPSV